MPRKMGGEFVERALHRRLVGQVGRGAERGEPGGALGVVGEQAVRIGAHDAPVGEIAPSSRPSAKRSSGRAQSGPLRAADVHFIARERCAVGEANPGNGAKRLLARQHRLDVDEPEPSNFARRPFERLRVGEARPSI